MSASSPAVQPQRPRTGLRVGAFRYSAVELLVALVLVSPIVNLLGPMPKQDHAPGLVSHEPL